MWIVVGMVGAAAVGAWASSNAAKKNAQAQKDINAQNIAADTAAHTMTPEEKANFFNTGVSKVNAAYTSSADLATRTLAARGLGGNAVAAPIANIGRSRAKSIGDVYSGLVNTQMSMRASTPAARAVAAPEGPSWGDSMLYNLSGIVGGAAGKAAGERLGEYFKPQKLATA